MRKNEKTILAILLVAVALIFILTQRGVPMSILAVSEVYIDPQYGYEDSSTGEWVGSYWVVLSTTHIYGDHVFYQLDDAEIQKYGKNTVGDRELHASATIKIDVAVGKPYVKRPLTKTPYTVCKPAYGYHLPPLGSADTYLKEHYDYDYYKGEWVKKKSGPIPQQDIVIKETASDWMWVVPLSIKATKIDEEGKVTALESDGETLVELDATGPEALIPIWFKNPEDESETFKFKLEGGLSTGFIVTLPDMSILPREDIIFEKTAGFLNHIKFSKVNSEAYVSYWYGPYGYGEGWCDNPDGSIYPSWAGMARGVFVETPLFHVYNYPAPMWIYSDPPPIDGKNYQGLVSYLEGNCRRLEDWEIDRWGEGYEVTENEIRIYMPYDSWLWMYTLTISTELADTYVWRPHYADGKILSAKWASSGTDKATISDQDQLEVTVKNVGTVSGNLRVRYVVSPADAPLQILGGGKFFEVDEEYTFTPTAKNLGPEKKVEGELLIELVNDAGAVRDDETVYFTLLPITGVTTLNVKLTEEGSTKMLSGITVSVQYGTQSQMKVSAGGWASFDLRAYQGPVEITAAESENYYGKVVSADVKTGGNTVSIELKRKEAPPPPPFSWWLIALLVIAVGVAIIVLMKKRRVI